MIKAIVVFDIDGVVRDVGGSYRRAISDTVEHFTQGGFRPTSTDIDVLKSEGIWNNDWDASQELIYRYFEGQGRSRTDLNLEYKDLVAFFQVCYRGLESQPSQWTGYICDEPLLVNRAYFESLTQSDIGWGFFSGAMRDEARYVLEGKLGLVSPVLVAMEDAPGKPDPTGLFSVVEELEKRDRDIPVIYVGDTVADIYTVEKAKTLQPSRQWIGVGVLPPHVQDNQSYRDRYRKNLELAGAQIVLSNMEELTPTLISNLI